MTYERKFRLQMTVRDRDVQTVFDLLHDVATDIKLLELHDESAPKTNGVHPTAYQTHKEATGSLWAQKLWAEIEPIFKHEKLHGDGKVRYNDPRLVSALVKSGSSPGTITPLLSQLRSLGKLTRPHRGWYTLP